MNCRELITFLETEVPLETAEGWDNPGFLVGDKEKEIKKVYWRGKKEDGEE